MIDPTVENNFFEGRLSPSDVPDSEGKKTRFALEKSNQQWEKFWRKKGVKFCFI